MLVFKKIILTSLYLVEGLAWWDWPFTWWTDQLLSFSACHCWLGHLTRIKIVLNMTYNVFGRTLNPTLLLGSIMPTNRQAHRHGWMLYSATVVSVNNYDVLFVWFRRLQIADVDNCCMLIRIRAATKCTSESRILEWSRFREVNVLASLLGECCLSD